MAKADSEDGRRALAELCDAYYEPVVAYLRMVLRDADGAREMGHAFFAAMLGGGTIHAAERRLGRFRSYLLGSVKHFIANQRDAARCLKRGGGMVAVALEDPEAHAVPDAALFSGNPDRTFTDDLRRLAGAKAISAAIGVKPTFGPVIESVLPFGAPCERFMLQFRTGRLFLNGHGPSTTKEQSEADWKIIDGAGGVDAQAYALEDGLQLDGEGCVFLRMEKPGWDDASAADVSGFLQHGSMVGLLEIRSRKKPPVTAFFKTARGDKGILQVLGVVDDERGFHGEGQKGQGVKLRYKLVQGSEAGTR